MGLFGRNKNSGETYDGQGAERKGLIDVIKYNEESDVLVWKFPYDNLTMGAQLIVNESQEAIFYKEGRACDVFGAGRHTLDASNVPILQNLINLPFGGKTPFTAEVWYISLRTRRNLGFGTMTPIAVLDPKYNVEVFVRSYGEYGIKIDNSSAFVREFVGTLGLFTEEEIIDQFKSLITSKLSSAISKCMLINKISILQINAMLDDISEHVKNAISDEFESYGIKITNVNVASVNYNPEDANIKKILDSQSEAEKRKMEGYTYQQERQFDIMEGAANNAGTGGDMMGAGIGLGMGVGVGGAFGAQMGGIAGVMNAEPVNNQNTPPPPPTSTAYHVLVNGQQTGPFDLNVIAQKIASTEINLDTMVWKQGMPQWQAAKECADLQHLFGAVPPPPPPPPPPLP